MTTTDLPEPEPAVLSTGTSQKEDEVKPGSAAMSWVAPEDGAAMSADESRLMRWFGPQQGRRSFRQSLLRVLSLVALAAVVALVQEALGLPFWVLLLVAAPLAMTILP